MSLIENKNERLQIAISQEAEKLLVIIEELEKRVGNLESLCIQLNARITTLEG